MIFENRQQAGQQLAQSLAQFDGQPDTVVLGLPRGGVPVAYPIAKQLQLPLDTFLVRKIGAPGHEELAIGAIAEKDVCLLKHDLINNIGASQQAVDTIIAQERQELVRRQQTYRGDKSLTYLQGKTVILVDDGIATGATMEAAIQALCSLEVKQIILATPVASYDSAQYLQPLVDEFVCLSVPEGFKAVGQWYRVFDQTSDDEVCQLLRQFQ